MDWFLYDNGLRYERVNKVLQCGTLKQCNGGPMNIFCIVQKIIAISAMFYGGRDIKMDRSTFCTILMKKFCLHFVSIFHI